jgi:hypothetical protein
MVMAQARSKYFSEDHLRKLLRQRLERGALQSSLAKEIGVSPAYLSKVLGGDPMTGKLVGWLGFRRVKIRMFEKL